MDQGVNKFGVSNIEYDLVTTLGNLLQATEVLERYAQDAEQAGDPESATIFRMIRENNKQSALQLRSALARHLSKS